MTDVFIVGSEGTTGLRLKQRLELRDDVRLIEISDDLRKDSDEIARLMGLADFTFLCLPDAAARDMAVLSKGKRSRIIDASTAHRTDDDWAYGFPELSPGYRSAIEGAERVSSPGCHSSGFIALTRPLVAEGLLSPEAVLSCASITGYSGGGKKMISRYEATSRPDELDCPMLYSAGQQHKHLPEMAKHSGLKNPPVFLPVVGGFYSGMLVSVPLDSSMLLKETDCEGLRRVYRRHYAESKLVQVRDDSPAALYASSAAGSDDMQIFVTGSDGRFLLCALFDNLGKGASGAAIQCFNIMCGLPEETGLSVG